MELDQKIQKTISLLKNMTISLNIQIDKIVHRFDVEKTVHAFFPLKSLNNTTINLFLQKL